MGHNYGGEPRLVMASGSSGWIAGIILGLFVLAAALVILVFATEEEPLWPAMIVALSIGGTAVFIWLILPSRYEIYDDRLVIAFKLWRWNIGLDSIELVREADSWQSYAYIGIRFSTKPSEAIELRRVGSNLFRRPNLIISPDDRSIFLPELNTVLARYRRQHSTQV